MTTPLDRMAFIRTNTRQLAPPLVPEILLHLAEESLPLWQKTEEELGEINVPPPFWAFAWAGGQALARYILDVPATVAAKSVLDVGSGSGLVAIAAAKAGATAVTANDIDAFANAACRLNAELNAVTFAINNQHLIAAPDSAKEAARLPAHTPQHSYDVITIGDLFYEQVTAAAVLAFAARARASGARILAGDPQRSYFPAHRFTKLVEYAVPVTRDLEDNEIKNTAVWEFDR